jgi:hypothetical protein
MNSSIINVLEVLNNAKNIMSAGFFLKYGFNEEDAARYFDELLEQAAIKMPVFSGIIIIKKTDDNVIIVDGIQRIITICLLLCALCENYKNTSKKNEASRAKIFDMFLTYNNKSKLILKNSEENIYKKILFSQDINEYESKNNLFKAYNRFLGKIKEKKLTGTHLFKIISQIQFLIIDITHEEMPIQDMYNWINQNKSEVQLDLIFNFLSQKESGAVFIWQKIIDEYIANFKQEFLVEFIKDFLNIQDEKAIINNKNLYNKFREYFDKMLQFQAPDKIIENIFKYSQYYLKILNADFEDDEIKEQFIILNMNEGKDAYSYLMEVLYDLDNNYISHSTFLEILKMVNSFVIKRQEDPTSNNNINFSSLSKEINKMLISSNNTSNFEDENKITINEINNLYTFEV